MTPELPIHPLLRQRLTESYGGNLSRMGRAVDATPTMLKKWISDDPHVRTVPSPGSCRKIARGLHLSIDDVLAMAGHRDADEQLAVQLDPRLAAFLAELELGWRAMDEASRDMAERTARALFHVPPVQRRVTKSPAELGSSNDDSFQPKLPRKRYQPQSVAAQRLAFGFQPA